MSDATIPLFLFFWLPAGKDAFGFKGWHSAPLNILGDLHDGIYDPISGHFVEQYAKLKEEGAFGSSFEMQPQDDRPLLEVRDTDTGLRQLKCRFVYKRPANLRHLMIAALHKNGGEAELQETSEEDEDGVGQEEAHVSRNARKTLRRRVSLAEQIFAEQDIEGEFRFLSSGLQIWQFNIKSPSADLTEGKDPDVRAAVRALLRHTFFNDVLAKLYGLEWNKFNAFKDDSGHLVLSPRKNRAPKPEEKEYTGVLNYYQLELFYNYIFSAEVIPQIFFRQSTPSSSIAKFSEALRSKYSLKNIFLSLTMVSWGEPKRQYFPLESDRKDYSLRGSCSDEDESYFVPALFLNKGSSPLEARRDNADHKPQAAALLRQLYYSRVCYAAMEQFMRVSITFGLMTYREGLDAARKIVLLNNFRAKENLETQQLYEESKTLPSDPPPTKEEIGTYEPAAPKRRSFLSRIFCWWKSKPPAEAQTTASIEDAQATMIAGSQALASLDAITCTPSFAEIYYELIKNKVPGLKLIYSLLLDMRVTLTPLMRFDPDKDGFPKGIEPAEHKVLFSAREYLYSERTVDAALRQFERQLITIENETEALRFLMERSGDRGILNELIETRKIHELNAEDRVKVRIDPDQWQQVQTGLQVVATGVAVAFGIFQAGTWVLGQIMDKNSKWWADLTRDQEIGAFAGVIILSALALAYSWSRAKSYRPEKPFSRPLNEPWTSIYDFANFREPLYISQPERLLNRWKSAMPKIFEHAAPDEPCRIHSVLSEMPTIGIEKRKYSFASQESDVGEGYTLHLEIEIHLSPLRVRKFYLTDLRLAIRAARDRENLHTEIDRLVTYYVSRLLDLDPTKPGNKARLDDILWRHCGVPRA